MSSSFVNLNGALLTCVGRTLLSVAFEVDFEFALKGKINPKTKINGDGQECPSYTGLRS